MKILSLFFCTFLFSIQSFAQINNELRKELNQIISSKNATIGISIKEIETQDTLSINGI